MHKQDLRAAMKLRLALCTPSDFERASHDACARLLASGLLEGVSSVGLYLALPNEISPEPLVPGLLARGMRLCVPAYDAGNNGYFMAAFDADTPLITGRFQVREPQDPLPVEPPELLLVPGLAFGPNGHRLGHGGGYYDRMTASWNHTRLVGFSSDAQWCTDIPMAEHDRRMDALITDQRTCLFTFTTENNRPFQGLETSRRDP